MKKRILSLLLSLVMVVCLLPTTALADIPENMDTWGGRQITHVDFVAYYAPDSTQDSYQMSRNALGVGKEVVTDQIQFVPTSLTWRQGATGTTTNTVTATENGDNGWRAVTTGTCSGLNDTTGQKFPLKYRAEGSIYRRNGTWAYNGAERWDRVYKSDMPNYVSGDYRYYLKFEVLDKYLKNEPTVANQYRIAPNVTVTVKWLGSTKTETFTVHPGSGMGVCNYTDNSMFVSTAGFFSSIISVTGTAPLKMGNGSTISGGYAGEAIKSFSVANLASGGAAPYTFAKVSGPDGIEVSADGTVSGAPTAACATDQVLKIRVTDKKGQTTEGEITVREIKAARTVIKTVVLSGLYQPYAGDDPANNRAGIVKVLDAAGNDITDTSPLKIAGIMSSWRVQGSSSRSWNHFTGLFEADKTYQYALQFRIEGEDKCAEYRLADDLTVTSSEFGSWEFKVGDYTDEANYQCRYAYSPSLAAGTATQLTGTVSYTGAARFYAPLNAHVNISTTGVDASTLRWKWQYKDGSAWYNIGETIEGATATITLSESWLKGRSIRAVVYSSDPAFSGTLYGAPLTVAKGWNMGIPAQPVVELSTMATSRVTVTDESFKGNSGVPDNERQEYIWTKAPSVDTNGYAVWPTDASIIIDSGTTGTSDPNKSVPLTDGISTYYVYTRYIETASVAFDRRRTGDNHQACYSASLPQRGRRRDTWASPYNRIAVGRCRVAPTCATASDRQGNGERP